MRRIAGMLFIAAIAAQGQTGAPSHQTGAKDLFYDSSSTAIVYAPAGGNAAAAGRRPAPPKNEEPRPVNVGIRFHVELLAEDGEVTPVAASRKFQSKERIRLAITSNVAGRLTILQQQDQGAVEVLFPGKNTPVEETIVSAGVPITIPRRGFRFDEHPGMVVLTVRVDPVRAPSLTAGAAPAGGTQARTLAVAAPIEETRRMAARGSKALVLEEDGPDTYCVQPVAAGQADAPLVTTIRLQHVR